ncbi:MAG: hypothetical protein IT373_02370 [Polyangiaceae bacterium]|nr:hypothetical protein [Polyangiaceae bacterium]
MTRRQLEHLIGAAATIADDDEIVVIGSQAVLGQFPDAAPELLVSVEADLYPKNHPELADLIDGSIGELSPFHDTFGYYAQGVGEETATLPRGWKERLVPVRSARTRGATGLCLEVHDLVVSKAVAGRDKDARFIAAAVRLGMVSVPVVRERLAATDLSDAERAVVEGRLAALEGA